MQSLNLATIGLFLFLKEVLVIYCLNSWQYSLVFSNASRFCLFVTRQLGFPEFSSQTTGNGKSAPAKNAIALQIYNIIIELLILLYYYYKFCVFWLCLNMTGQRHQLFLGRGMKTLLWCILWDIMTLSCKFWVTFSFCSVDVANKV
mgnify:CR=1 FL=1